MRRQRSPKTLEEAILLFSHDAVCELIVKECRWSDGVVRCPYCGSDKVTYLQRVRRFKCYGAHPKAQFSLKVGTLFEDSAVGFEQWLPALWMLTNGKIGISSYELARALGVTQKTAWSMLARLRRALDDEPDLPRVPARHPSDTMDRFRAALRRALAAPNTAHRVSRGKRTRRTSRSSGLS